MFNPLDITEDDDGKNKRICMVVMALPTPGATEAKFNCFWQPFPEN